MNAMETLGAGAAKRAIGLDEKRVRVESKDAGELTPEQSKSIYYMTRIASILFPDNIPHVSAAWIDKDTMKTNFIAQKVKHDPVHKRFQAFKDAQERGKPVVNAEKEWEGIQNEFERRSADAEYVEFVNKACAAGLTEYEYQPHNFSYDSDGTLKFFDLEPAWHQWKRQDGTMVYKLSFVPAKLLPAIQALPDEKKGDAINAYRSIIRLAPEELKKLLPTTI